jgi:hypothetical protein
MFLDSILYEDALYIGSPISGTLANACISNPVKDIKDKCFEKDIKFSIYADDMTFSANYEFSTDELYDIVHEVLKKYEMDEYLKVNESKTIQLKNQKRFITGVRINHEDELTVSKIIYRKLRSYLHNIKNSHSKKVITRIRGLLNYALQVDTTGKIEKLVNEYINDISTYNLATIKAKAGKINIRRW